MNAPQGINPPQDRVLYHLQYGPFAFESELEIPELHTVVGSNRIPVTVRQGDVPTTLDGGVVCEPGWIVTAQEAILDIEGVCRYYVARGQDVRLQIAPGAPRKDITSYLLGSIFGMLCHQNHLFPLHASAVQFSGAPDGSTAFLGDSGAGKSTLAACLARRGHTITADDICLLEPGDTGMAMIPVAGWLKLWKPSLDHLGIDPQESFRIFEGEEKFRHYLNQQENGQTKLANIVFLERTQTSTPSLEPLRMLPTAAAMLPMVYVGWVVEMAGEVPRLFSQCVKVASSTNAFRLSVPWGWENMGAVLELLEANLNRS